MIIQFVIQQKNLLKKHCILKAINFLIYRGFSKNPLIYFEFLLIKYI